jgi:membrane glycosyltransferase
MGPKLLGVIVALTHRRKQFGGARAIVKGTVIETIFAVLIAPIMMVYHAYFVISVFLGFKVNWDSQDREGRLLPWGECIARTSKMTTVAIAWGVMTYVYAPIFFWWLLPVLTGLVLAAPLVRYSSSLDWGRRARAHNIFLTPDETGEDPVLTELNSLLAAHHAPLPSPATIPELPADNWTDMPHRALGDYQTVTR